MSFEIREKPEMVERALLAERETGGTYNVGSGAGTAFRDLAEHMAREFSPLGHLSEVAVRPGCRVDLDLVLDIEKAKAESFDALKNTIREQMQKNMESRREKQPLEYPSAGSVFKRPVDNFAARMIDTAGLKGVSVGGAQVSEKHAGFIVNRGGATAEDVKTLVRLVQDEVEKLYRYRLECEIQLVSDGLGDDGDW